VLWLDADVCYYPKDIIQQLVETGKEIVVPNCLILVVEVLISLQI